MPLPRRRFLRLAASAAVLSTVSRNASAQSYPSRPVRIVVGFAPGGGADIAGRLIAQWLSERLGQQFVVENRPGAGANIAMDAVAKATPDGYTLLLLSPGAAINATLYEKLPYNFVRDFAPISGFLRVPNVMVLNPSVPAKTLPDFVAYAKANPGKVNMASAGSGSSVHVSGELFKMMAGVDLTHVPYRGAGPMLSDLLGGRFKSPFRISDHRSSTSEPASCARLLSPRQTVRRRCLSRPSVSSYRDMRRAIGGASLPQKARRRISWPNSTAN